jgi:hypothetical protein
MLKAKLIERGVPKNSWDDYCSTSKLSSESAQALHPYFLRRKPKNNENSHQQ